MTRLAEFPIYATYRIFRVLPPPLTSALGAFLGHLYALHAYASGHLWFKRTIRNFQDLGETDARSAKAMAFQLLRNLGRVRAEFAVIDRCRRYVEFEGLGHLARLRKPAIVVSPHLGNWEIAGSALVLNGKSVTALYDPPASQALHILARETRLRLLSLAPGSRLIAASQTSMRDLVRSAQARENLLIYIDELSKGVVWSPPLGRTMPMKGNRVYAAQLALKYDMEVLPIYVVRSGGLKLRVVIEDPIEVKPSGDMASDVRLLAARISERTEVWVREHLTQWYWLPEFRAERGGNYRVTQS